MKVLFPFNQFDNYYSLRYGDQIKAIAEFADKVEVFANVGTPVTNLNHPKINVTIFKQRRAEPIQKNWKYYAGKYSASNYWLKPYRVMQYAKGINALDGDIILGFSGSGWQEMTHCVAGLLGDIPKVHRMRGNGRKERKFFVKFPNRQLNDLLEVMAYRLYDYHIPINQEYHEILIRRGVPKHLINEPVGLGVDTEFFKPLGKPREYFGFIGRNSKEKGTPFLRKIIDATPQIQYLVAGVDWENETLPDNVVCLGRVQKTEIPEIMNKCKAVLLPSYTEGVSNVIFEAYATGTPMILTPQAKAPCFPLFGFMLEHDLDSWITHIKDFDNLVQDDWFEDSRQWAKQNSWQSFGKRIVDIFEKVIEDSK